MIQVIKSLRSINVMCNKARLVRYFSNVTQSVSFTSLNYPSRRPISEVFSIRIISRDLNTFGSSPSGISEVNESDIVRGIKEIIEDKIRPTIQEDGGDIEFISYEHNIVKVRLQGACKTCPSSVITLKNGVKSMLQYHVPEILDVEQVEDDE